MNNQVPLLNIMEFKNRNKKSKYKNLYTIYKILNMTGNFKIINIHK